MTIKNLDSNLVKFQPSTLAAEVGQKKTLQSLPIEVRELIIDKIDPQGINFHTLKYLIHHLKIPSKHPLSMLPRSIRPLNEQLPFQNPTIEQRESILKVIRTLELTQISSLRELRNYNWAFIQLNRIMGGQHPLSKLQSAEIGGFTLTGESEPYYVRARISKISDSAVPLEVFITKENSPNLETYDGYF